MKLSAIFTSLSSLVPLVAAQLVGNMLREVHPSLSWQLCTTSGGCTSQAGSITLDANWRWLPSTGFLNCYTGNSFNPDTCSDGITCAKNCRLEGADYSYEYGITTSADALRLKFKTEFNTGSRVYMMANDTTYQLFKLKNQEFTFDVETSNLGCGLKGSLYFVEMDADGGKSKYPLNKAGAKYGTGYCDSQCPHDLRFINGEGNVIGWTPSSTDPNTGYGKYGSCCNELDIWQANQYAATFTTHGCSTTGPYRCESYECGDDPDRYGGVCDKDGCDFNSYRLGNTSFLGPGLKVDTKQKITVVTQIITSDGTANGALTEIRRLYVQNGNVISNSRTNIAGMSPYDSITPEFCNAQKTAFGDYNDFVAKGGNTPMDVAMNKGMVLVMSIRDDPEGNLLWLDSTWPTDSTWLGAARGPCTTVSGNPIDPESEPANVYVVFSNIKVGDIGSTYDGNVTSSFN